MTSLKDINLSEFNTHNINNKCYIFLGCNSLSNLNLSNFNTQNITNRVICFLDGVRYQNLI